MTPIRVLIPLLLSVSLSAGTRPDQFVEVGWQGKFFDVGIPAKPSAKPPKRSVKVTPGDFYVEPSTLHSLGFEWIVRGDENRNARVAVRYRPVGEKEWRQGPDLLRP